MLTTFSQWLIPSLFLTSMCIQLKFWSSCWLSTKGSLKSPKHSLCKSMLNTLSFCKNWKSSNVLVVYQIKSMNLKLSILMTSMKASWLVRKNSDSPTITPMQVIWRLNNLCKSSVTILTSWSLNNKAPNTLIWLRSAKFTLPTSLQLLKAMPCTKNLESLSILLVSFGIILVDLLLNQSRLKLIQILLKQENSLSKHSSTILKKSLSLVLAISTILSLKAKETTKFKPESSTEGRKLSRQ